jgi:DNA-binding transcriptional regulator/RsmH inhibitor MraZ
VPDSLEQPEKTNPPEAPVGIFEAKCDEKGRVKLPVRFAVYLKSLDNRFFITTLDTKVARIYPESVWKSNQIYFNNAGPDSHNAADVSFIANLYGDFSTIDESGRILVPTELRRKLEFEKQSVWLNPHRGHIQILNKAVYAAKLQRAMIEIENKANAIEEKGFL